MSNNTIATVTTAVTADIINGSAATPAAVPAIRPIPGQSQEQRIARARVASVEAARVRKAEQKAAREAAAKARRNVVEAVARGDFEVATASSDAIGGVWGAALARKAARDAQRGNAVREEASQPSNNGWGNLPAPSRTRIGEDADDSAVQRFLRELRAEQKRQQAPAKNNKGQKKR